METDTEIETDIKEIGGPTWKAWVHFVDPETLTSTVWVTAQIGGGKTWGDTDVLERQNIGHFMAMLDATMEVSMNEISREQAHALVVQHAAAVGERARALGTAASPRQNTRVQLSTACDTRRASAPRDISHQKAAVPGRRGRERVGPPACLRRWFRRGANVKRRKAARPAEHHRA